MSGITLKETVRVEPVILLCMCPKVSVITGSETTAVNRFAGVVEPQKTVNVKIESGRKVKEVEVKTGEEVKAGQLPF